MALSTTEMAAFAKWLREELEPSLAEGERVIPNSMSSIWEYRGHVKVTSPQGYDVWVGPVNATTTDLPIPEEIQAWSDLVAGSNVAAIQQQEQQEPPEPEPQQPQLTPEQQRYFDEILPAIQQGTQAFQQGKDIYEQIKPTPKVHPQAPTSGMHPYEISGVKQAAILEAEKWLGITKAATATFTGLEIDEILTYAQYSPNAFLADLRIAGRNADTEALLKGLWPGISEGEIQNIFVTDPLTDREKANLAVSEEDRLKITPLDRDLASPFFEAEEREFPEITEQRIQVDTGERIIDTLLGEDGYLHYQGVVIGEVNLVTGEITPRNFKASDIGASIVAGIGDAISSTGQAIKWMGADGLCKQFADLPAMLTFQEPDSPQTYQEKMNVLGGQLTSIGGSLSQYAPPQTLGEFSWEHLYNPAFWGTTVARTMTTSMAIMAPSLAAAYVTAGMGAPAILGNFGKMVMAGIGGAAVSRPMESAWEAGQAFDEALERGLSPEEAKKVADGVFRGNMQLAVADFTQFAFAFAPGSSGILARLVGQGLVRATTVAGKMVIVGLSEGGEEMYQETLLRWARGESFALDPDMWQVMALGGIMGVSMAGAGDVLTHIKSRTVNELSPAARDDFQKNVRDFVAQGMDVEAAELKALDLVANTPEGQQVINDVIEAVRREEIRREIKPKDAVDEIVIERTLGPVPPPIENVVSPGEEAMAAEEVEAPVTEAGMPEAGLQAGMMGVEEQVVRPKGKGKVVQAEMDIEGMARFWEEAQQLEDPAAEIEAIEEYLQSDPVASYRGFVGKAKTTLTSILRGGDWPESITVKQAQMLLQGREIKPNVMKEGRVRWEYVMDEMSEQFGMTEDQLINHLQGIRKMQRRVSALKIELAGGETMSTGAAQEALDLILMAREDSVEAVGTETASTRYFDDLLSQLEQGQISAEEATARAQHEQLSKMSQYYQQKIRTQEQTKQSLLNYVKNNLPLFGKRQQGTMMTAIKNVKTELGLQKQIARVDAYAEANAQKVLTGQINKELSRTATKKVSGIPRGKFTAEVQSWLDTVRANLHNDRGAVNAEIAANIDKYEAGEMTPEELADRNNALSMAGVDGMTSAELQDVLANIRSVKDTGKMLRQEEMDAWREKMAGLRSDFVGEITGGKGVTSAPGEGAMSTNVFRKIAQHNLALAELLNELSRPSKAAPYTSRLNKWGENVPASRGALNKGLRTRNAEVREAAEGIFKEGKRRWGQAFLNARLNQVADDVIDLGVFTNAEGKPQSIKMTKGEMMSAVMAMRDPTLDATLREGNRYTDEMMAAVNNALTTEETAWVDWMMGFYQSYGNTLAPFWERHFHVRMPRNPFYSPISREAEIKTPEPVLFMQEQKRYATTTSGSHKARVKTTSALIFHDATRTLVNHYTQMEHWMAWQDTIREWRSVFMNPEVRRAIKQYHGVEIQKHLNTYIENLARGAVDAAKLNNVLDKLRRNFTIAILAIKPAIAIKQLPSGLAYTTQMPIRDYFAGALDWLSHPLKATQTLKEKSASLDRRWGGAMERDIGLVMERGEIPQLTGKTNIKQKFMLPIRMMDKFATAMGSWAVYKSELKRGATDEEAILQAEIVTERTQPSFNIESLAPLQNGGSFWKLATMFQNQPNKYWRLYYTNFDALVTGRGNRAKASYNIALAWVVLPMIFQFMADAFQWKEKHMLRAALFGPLNFLLAGGQIFQSLTGWATGETFPWSASPAFTTMDKFLKSILKTGQLIGDWQDPFKNIDMEDVWDLMEYLGYAGGALTGLPTPWIIQAEKGLREGDPRTLIFSQWSLENPDKSMYGKAEDFSLMMGETLELEEGQFEAEIYDAHDYFMDAKGLLKHVLPSDVIGDKAAPADLVAVAEALVSLSEYESLPSVKLYQINTDLDEDWTIIDYYKQWQAREKIDNLADLAEFDKIYPKAHLGNVSRREYDLLKKYLESEDKDAFLDEHPELKVNPRIEWLKANPEDNAKLAIWGEAKILTPEAYDIVQKLIRELDIPDSAVAINIPPEKAAPQCIAFWNASEEHGTSSWEAQLELAKMDDAGLEYLRESTGNKYEVETPIEALELLIKNRPTQELWEGMTEGERETWLEKNTETYDSWKQDEKRVEAIGWGWDEKQQDWYVERRGLDGSELTAHDQANPEYYQAYRNKERQTLVDKYGEDSGNVINFDAATEDHLGKDERVVALDIQWAAQDEEYEIMPADDRAGWLDENHDYHVARRTRDAYNAGVAEVKAYVDWYTTERSGFEDDWFLIDNTEFYQEMVDKEIWQEKNFTKVPTRDMAALLDERDALRRADGSADTAARKAFELEHPEVDVYMHLAHGNKLENEDVSVDLSEVMATGTGTFTYVPSPEEMQSGLTADLKALVRADYNANKKQIFGSFNDFWAKVQEVGANKAYLAQGLALPDATYFKDKELRDTYE